MKLFLALTSSILLLTNFAQSATIDSQHLTFSSLRAEVLDVYNVAPNCNPEVCDRGATMLKIRYMIDCDQSIASVSARINEVNKEIQISIIAWSATPPFAPRCLSTWQEEKLVALPLMGIDPADFANYAVVNLETREVLEVQ